MTQIIITEAVRSHARYIAAIGRTTFLKSFGHLFKRRDELFGYLDYIYNEDKIARSLQKEDNIYLIAWKEDMAIGFAKLKKHSLNDYFETVSQVELQKLYVLPSYQSIGAGQALMNRVRCITRGLSPDYVWLNAQIGNGKAIKFYEENGFKKMDSSFFLIGTQLFESCLMGMQVTTKKSRPVHF